MKHRPGRIAAVILTVASIITLGATSAAADWPPSTDLPLDADHYGYGIAPDRNSVGSAQIIDGQVYQKDINPAVVAVLRTPAKGSVWQSTLNAGIVSEDKLSPAVRGKLNASAPAEVFGKSGETIAIAPKTIAYLGGPYFDPARGFTTLGEFRLPAGTWLVNTSVKFHRTAAGVVGTRPQLGLRIGQDPALPGDAKWGTEVGTVGGTEISPGNGHDLFGSATKVIALTETTTVGVYGFGYNNDTGTAGSGQIQAGASVTPVRVG